MERTRQAFHYDGQDDDEQHKKREKSPPPQKKRYDEFSPKREEVEEKKPAPTTFDFNQFGLPSTVNVKKAEYVNGKAP